MVGFEKIINETVTGGIAVPDTSRRELIVVSAYVNKKKVFQTPDANAPCGTSGNESESPPDNSLANADESGKMKMSITVPVERINNLIAQHNLTDVDLRNALDLGGFPMPSIAVIKADMGHDMYGGISLLFHSDTIDPRRTAGISYTIRHFCPIVWQKPDGGFVYSYHAKQTGESSLPIITTGSGDVSPSENIPQANESGNGEFSISEPVEQKGDLVILYGIFALSFSCRLSMHWPQVRSLRRCSSWWICTLRRAASSPVH